MKILNSISTLYNDQKIFYKILEKKVEETVTINIKKEWYFFHRIKSLESFALKLETGRFDNKKILHDLFACTIVVENSAEIKNAKTFIKKYCTVIDKIPYNDTTTSKNPYTFRFDDLRLYVKLKPTIELTENKSTSIYDIIFEFQIKTFLQHAWAVSTHDLIYKGDEISWAKQRVASQIKAMLEHAEISIEKIESIKESPILQINDKDTRELNKVKRFLEENWKDKLPTDIIRISKNIHKLKENFGLTIEQMQECLDKDTKLGRGSETMNLSPFYIVLQSIINQSPKSIEDFSNSDQKDKIFIPKEMDTSNIDISDSKVVSV